MSKRKYTNIKAYENEILKMFNEGRTRREIGEKFGFSREQIHECIKRYKRWQRKMEAGILPQPKGRPRKDAVRESLEVDKDYIIKNLKMENALLRDFLHLAGRK